MRLLGNWSQLDLQVSTVLLPPSPVCNTMLMRFPAKVQQIDGCHEAMRRRSIVLGIRGRSWTIAGKGKEKGAIYHVMVGRMHVLAR